MALAVDVMDRHGPTYTYSYKMRHQIQPKETKAMLYYLFIYVAAKEVLRALHY